MFLPASPKVEKPGHVNSSFFGRLTTLSAALTKKQRTFEGSKALSSSWPYFEKSTYHSSAIREAGVHAVAGRARAPLSFSWEKLRAQLAGQHKKLALSRFMSFCSERQVAPEKVSADTFEEFGRVLEEQSLVSRSRDVYREACKTWNWAVENALDWPQVKVPVPNRRRQYAMTMEVFPSSFGTDVEAFLTRSAIPDPFDENYYKPVKPVTTKNRRLQILQLATALVKSGYPVNQMTNLATLVEPENAKTALRFFYERAGGKSTGLIYHRAALIKTIAKYWVKVSENDLKVLKALCSKLLVPQRGMTPRNKLRLRQFDDPANLAAFLHLPQKLIKEAAKEDGNNRSNALKAMFALIIEILTMAPMRFGNLNDIDLGRHIIRTRPGVHGVVHLVIPGDETKNEEPYEVAFVPASAELLDVYLKKYRPMLASTPSVWLFPNPKGQRRNRGGFASQIGKLIYKKTGLRMNPHLFRHLAAKLHLDKHPGEYETARRILGHKSIDTTMRFYAELKSVKDIGRYDEHIAKLRERNPVETLVLPLKKRNA